MTGAAPPDFATILAARARLAGVVRRTPLLGSPRLDAIAGRRVLVKAEGLQHTGSFKFRGAMAAVTAMPARLRARGVLAWSSGNHGQAVAEAARRLDVPAVVVMPADAPAAKREKVAALGAELVLHDRAGPQREELGRELCARRGLAPIPPFDDAQVIAGQASCGLEIAEQAATAGVHSADVLVCCGGGGLTAGIALALAERSPGLRARPVEPEGFDDTARALALGRRVGHGRRGPALCDAILTPAPGEITFPVMARLCGPGLAVGDDEVRQAMALAFAHLGLVVEPGGAVALAAALFHGAAMTGDAVIAVATGANVDAAVFCRALARLDSHAAV